MNKTEFLDLLRYYFRNISEKDLAEILADYEAHFEEGAQRGLSEEEISKELGSPKDVYEMYRHEGMLEEKSEKTDRSAAAEKLADAAEKLADSAEELAGKAAGHAGNLAAKAQDTWSRDIGPRVPEAAERASSLLIKALIFACCTVGFLIILITALTVYLLSGTFPALGGLPPLPGLAPLTLAGLFGTGFFAGLALFFVGLEIRRFGGRGTPPSAPASSAKEPTPEKKGTKAEPVSKFQKIQPREKRELRIAEMLAVAFGK